eukprot:11194787-Lingulodinium_polyedra.AAC.1
MIFWWAMVTSGGRIFTKTNRSETETNCVYAENIEARQRRDREQQITLAGLYPGWLGLPV